MFALYHVLLQFYTPIPPTPYGMHAQLVFCVGNEPVVRAFRKGRAEGPVTHALLIKLYWSEVITYQTIRSYFGGK